MEVVPVSDCNQHVCGQVGGKLPRGENHNEALLKSTESRVNLESRGKYGAKTESWDQQVSGQDSICKMEEAEAFHFISPYNARAVWYLGREG